MVALAYSPYLQGIGFSGQDVHERQALRRLERLCRRAVDVMAIDLAGMRVLTEAATGPFATTAVIAALAGADVRAVTRDSRWGPGQAAIDQVCALAEQCGVAERIKFSMAPPSTVASDCDLVTNLGFLRPIDQPILQALSPEAAVSLMWEPWEFRPGEIDCDTLDALGIPLVATNEHHPEVSTFEYLGPTIGRLMLDIGLEVVNARVGLVASNPFGAAIAKWLGRAGADVFRCGAGELDASNIDVLVLAEHRDSNLLIGPHEGPLLDDLARLGVPIVRLCGRIEMAEAARRGVAIYPANDVAAGVMTITTAYAGPRPVIDLHAAGLKAGGEAVRARRGGADAEAAVAAAVRSGFGLAVDRTAA